MKPSKGRANLQKMRPAFSFYARAAAWYAVAMKRSAYSFLILLASLSVISVWPSAMAQDTPQSPPPPRVIYAPFDDSYNYAAGPLYRQMIVTAMTRRPADFNFTQFRSLYAQYAHYEPLAALTQNMMLDKAFYIIQEKDDAKREKMLLDYRLLVQRHLANIDIVSQALALARQDARFGDPELYAWLRRGLLDSVLHSGNGQTLATAYEIIALGEETALLSALGVRVIQSLNRESGMVAYNIYDVEVLRDGSKRSIFTNITIPMNTLQARQRDSALSVDIRSR